MNTDTIVANEIDQFERLERIIGSYVDAGLSLTDLIEDSSSVLHGTCMTDLANTSTKPWEQKRVGFQMLGRAWWLLAPTGR